MEQYRTQVIHGTTYAYLDRPYWNPEKKRGEHKREYIGKVVDGQFVPNQKYLLRQQAGRLSDAEEGPACLSAGAVWLVDRVAEELGIPEDLEACFGRETADAVRSLACWLVMEDREDLSRYPGWSRRHRAPGCSLEPQKIQKVFSALPEESISRYFRLQAERRPGEGSLIFETCSPSSLSALSRQAEQEGRGGAGEICLLTLCGKESGLPLGCRVLPGRMPDARSLESFSGCRDFPDSLLIPAPGFCSEKNISSLLKRGDHFLLEARPSFKPVSRHLNEEREYFATIPNYSSGLDLYRKTWAEEWSTGEGKRKKGRDRTGRVYIHCCFDAGRCAAELDRFGSLLESCEEELRAGIRVPGHEELYREYFRVQDSGISRSAGAIRKAEKNFGYTALLTDCIEDPDEALRIYRLREPIRCAYEDLEDRLDPGGLSSTPAARRGRIFVQSVALGISAGIRSRMASGGLERGWTLQSLLDELDCVEAVRQSGGAFRLSGLTETRLGLYEKLGVRAPEVQ